MQMNLFSLPYSTLYGGPQGPTLTGHSLGHPAREVDRRPRPRPAKTDARQAPKSPGGVVWVWAKERSKEAIQQAPPGAFNDPLLQLRPQSGSTEPGLLVPTLPPTCPPRGYREALHPIRRHLNPEVQGRWLKAGHLVFFQQNSQLPVSQIKGLGDPSGLSRAHAEEGVLCEQIRNG